MEKLRSLYLYLNKNKKFIFDLIINYGFLRKNTENLFYKKNDLLAQIDDTINEGIMSNYKLEYLKLLRKNINDYRSDYNTIGLVLNRLFIPDIASRFINIYNKFITIYNTFILSIILYKIW